MRSGPYKCQSHKAGNPHQCAAVGVGARGERTWTFYSCSLWMSVKGVFSYWRNVFFLMSVLPKFSLSESLPRQIKKFPLLLTLSRALTDRFFFSSFLRPASLPFSFSGCLIYSPLSHFFFLIYLKSGSCTTKSIDNGGNWYRMLEVHK